jgi:hypothetical protein
VDTTEIIAEMKSLADQELGLVLARPGEASSTITVHQVLGVAGSVLVEVSKPPELVLDEVEPYYVFYQGQEQGLMRGFFLHFVRQSERFARAELPGEIFEIQRRKFPRVFTPQQSLLTCVLKNSRRLVTAQVLDVSLEGARIFGDLEGLGRGSVLSPLTLTLYFRARRRAPTVINIAEAVVVREVRIKEKAEVCFHFDKSDSDYQVLAEYIDLRSQELDLS